MIEFTYALTDSGAEFTLTKKIQIYDSRGGGERHSSELSCVFSIQELETLVRKLSAHVENLKA